MKFKKLQLIIILLFILIILLVIIGLILIDFCDYHTYVFNDSTLIFENIEKNGFELLKITSIIYILSVSANYICEISQSSENFYNWIELQIGVIFCIIIVPILTFIFSSLVFLNIGLLIKLKNNNFWDAIQNCEIINNYYIH